MSVCVLAGCRARAKGCCLNKKQQRISGRIPGWGVPSGRSWSPVSLVGKLARQIVSQAVSAMPGNKEIAVSNSRKKNGICMVGALACAGLLSAGVTPSFAAFYTPDFSGPLTLSNSSGPGVWYTDRTAPGGFTTSGGVLSETVGTGIEPGTNPPTDYPTSGFYATQGRDYNINLSGNVQTASIELYLQSNWSTPTTGDSTNVVAGFWGAGAYANGGVSAYPIISFINDPSYVINNNPAGYSGPTGPGFYTYNYMTSTGNFNFVNTAPIYYGGWNTLTYTLTVGTGVEYYVNGVDVGGIADTGTASLATVLLEVKNYGTQYTAQWAAATPIPGTGLLAAVGSLALIGGLALRRRMASKL